MPTKNTMRGIAMYDVLLESAGNETAVKAVSAPLCADLVNSPNRETRKTTSITQEYCSTWDEVELAAVVIE